MMKHNVYQSEEQPHDHKSTKAQSLWSEQIQEDGHLFYVDSKRSEWQNETDKAEKGCSRESSISGEFHDQADAKWIIRGVITIRLAGG
jgi:hypothetical protein